MGLPKPKLRLPKRNETILLVIGMFLVWWIDVLLNKYQDFGIGYKVCFLEGLCARAIDLFWILVFVYIGIILTLTIRAVLNRRTWYVYDAIGGGIMLFGIVVIVTGGISFLFMEKGQTIPFLFMELKNLDFHHLFGILPQIIGAAYFALTE